MRKLFNQPGRRSGMLLMICLAMLAAAACIFSVHAQCEISTNGYVYLHPYFSGRNWRTAEKELEITIPDNFCTYSLDGFSITRSDSANVAAFTTAGGNFYLSQVDFNEPSPLCLCCKPQLVFNAPAELDLSGEAIAPDSPLYLLNQTGYTYDNARLVLAGDSDSLVVLSVAGDAAQITDRQSLALTRKAHAQRVAAISGAYNESTEQDTGVYAVGSGGLIRYFPFDGTNFGAEQDLDIASGETVLCTGGGNAGTQSGAIYRWSGSAFVRDTTPAAVPVNAIGSSAAVGGNGAIFIRSQGQWQTYTSGSANYRAFGLFSHERGSAIELLDENWSYGRHVYSDRPTVIASIEPAYIEPFINNADPYIYEPASGDFSMELNLSDPDGNITVPDIRVGDTDFTADQDGALQD
ncbi:MAG: hypothetical protein GF350_13885, partial [Chitinivibrionales bacterium]|nr:hypothetical protein [Chitinivibrionales bacterium]